eukprot:236663_1
MSSKIRARRNKKKRQKSSSLLGDSNPSSPSSTPKSKNKSRDKKSKPEKDRKIDSNSSQKPPTQNSNDSSLTLRQKVLYIGGAIAFLAVLIMLKQGEEQYGWSGIDRPTSEDDTSFYEVLEIDSRATQAQIKKAYRTLSLKYHPDRNPNCGKKCHMMTSKLNQAYETLGEPQKRQIYDSTQGYMATIPSAAIELTYDNFDDYVTNSRGLFIIQVYAEQYAECKSFSTIWEDATERFSGYIQFGRVHAVNHVSVVRRLGASIRDYPTVLSYVDGRYFQTYPAVRNPKKLFDLIHEDYPTRHLWKGDETKLNGIHHKWLASDPKLPLIMVATKKINPSLSVSWMAKQYDGVVKFVHLNPKPGSKTNAKQTKQSTGRIRFLSNGLKEVFGVKQFKDHPKLITISPQGDSKVIDEKIDKHNLKSFIRKYVQDLVPKFSPWTYTTVCGDHDIYCVIYMVGCDGKRQKRGLRDYTKLAKKTVPHIQDIEENYYPKWVQFGFIDVLEDPLLRPLCGNRNDTELILVYEAQTMMKIVKKKVKQFDNQLLFEYMELVLNHEAEEESMDAPRIVPPPPPRASVIDDMVEFVEELDWRDKDLQLNLIIICGMVGFVLVCKNCGLKGAVMTLFAMSIVGGMLPTMLALFTGAPGGAPGGRGRRGR